MDGAMTVFNRILNARRLVMQEGFVPVDVELGPAEREGLGSSFAGAGSIAGMRVQPRMEPGITVLALPNRKIGRYEIVPPTRFGAEGLPIPNGELEAINGRLA